MDIKTDYHWQIERKVEETPTTTSLYLKPLTEKPTFRAGQYVTIKIPQQSPVEGKAYSISSAPHEAHVRISIKKMGTFSQALLSLNIEDQFTTSAPYGFFYPEETDDNPLVFIAGGIGITPFLSIITHLTYQKDNRPITLFYSNQTEADTAFQQDLDKLLEQNQNLSIHHTLTRESTQNKKFLSGRFTPDQIITFTKKQVEPQFFLCGSMDFTRGLWKGLRESGIPQHQIHTEGFF